MSEPQTLDLTPAGAARILDTELVTAADAWRVGAYDSAVDGYVRALGLALQLGPAPAEQTLAAVLQATRELESSQEAEALATLGPALVDLVRRVRKAGALPATSVMEAWAELAIDVGALLGQVGLACTLPPERHREMTASAHARATLLDDASSGILGLGVWLDAKFGQSRQ
jgi:hypothetical protein